MQEKKCKKVGLLLVLAFALSLFVGVYAVFASVSFQPAVNYPVGDLPEYITAADFDNDGNVDLAVTNYLDNDVSVLLGDGTGSFGTATDFSVGDFPWGITAADFDNDGNVDLAVANYDDDVSVLLGDGTGSFGTATDFSVGYFPQGITAADFDGNSRLDLATANNGSDSVSVLLQEVYGNPGTH